MLGFVTMSRSRRFFLALLLAAGFNSHTLGSDACLRRAVAVNVVDKSGATVSGLAAANFQGQVDGKQVRVTSFQADMRSRRILILLDTSRSMTDVEEKWKVSWTLTEHAIVFAPESTPVGLLVFDDRVRLKLGFGERRPVMLKRLADLASGYESTDPHWPFPQASQGADRPGNRGAEPETKTALWDALQEALKSMGPFEIGDAIYIISDGGDTGSGAQQREIEAQVAAIGARVFSLVPLIEHPGSFFVGDERMAAAKLAELSESSGGHNLLWRTASDRHSLNTLAEKLKPFYDEMARYHRVEIELPNPVEKPIRWKLEVTGSSGKLKVRYPRQLFPCEIAEPRTP